MTYSKKRFLNNLAYLMKKKNVRIGEIETACNVSAGYFSRIKNDENDSQCPNIEVLYAICDKLDVTIDFLLNAELVSLNETEEYALTFINFLTTNTETGKLQWEKEYRENVVDDGNHVLNHWVSYNNNGFGEPELEYESLFTNKLYQIVNDVCYLDMEDNKRIYLVQLNIVNYKGEQESIFPQYEMYMVIGDKKKKVINGGDDTKGVFAKTLDTLFSFALKSSNDVKIDDEVKDEMKKFIKSFDLPF